MNLIVYTDGWLKAGDRFYRAAYGRCGIKPKQQEGDGISPEGTWPLRRAFYRADRMDKPATGLPLDALKPTDAWCDIPGDAQYNRLVTLPYASSQEPLWRADHLFDVIVVFGYNDAPVIDGRGSSLFFHLARETYSPTAGCAAVSLPDMLEILPNLSTADTLTFLREASGFRPPPPQTALAP